MRGVFGLLLIGGGVILVYGLFTGKINFSVPAASTNLSPADVAKTQKNAGTINPTNGTCPSGYTLLGGQCWPQSVLGQI